MRLLALLLLCSCDKVFVLDDHTDALNPCTRPNFNDYAFTQRAVWGMGPNVVLHPTMDAANVYFQLLGGGLYTAPIDSTTAVNGVPEETGFTRFHPSLTADKQALLFQRREFPSYNIIDVRAWTLGQSIAAAALVEFFIGGVPTVVEPGPTGRFRGEQRMVGWTIPMTNNFRLVEMKSSNLERWDEVVPDPIPWRLEIGRELDTSLSPDGCVLLFVSSRSNLMDVYFSWRLDDGSFATPERLEASSKSHYQRGPTLGPDGRVWFLRGDQFNQDNQTLWVGTPPA